MGGGLLQLVAYGAQDVYLTGNPQITFFKVVYRRHTNFALESIQQTFNGTPGFNNKIVCTVSRNGDLINRAYIEIELKTLTDKIKENGEIISGNAELLDTYQNYKNYVGLILLKNVSIEIGGQQIDKHYSEWMYIWNELSLPVGKKEGYKKMVGSDGLLLSSKENKESNKLIIPLEFWFCRNVGLALPLIALQYHEVKLNITFCSLEEIILKARIHKIKGKDEPGSDPIVTFDEDNIVYVTDVNNISFPKINIWLDYIYLDTDERRKFAQSSHEYLIEQLQFTGEEIISSKSMQTQLNFNHPVKEIVWVNKKINDITTTEWPNYQNNLNIANLKLNGNDRFTPRDGKYFSHVQPYQHHTNIPEKNNIFVYSFALKPEEHQPSGTLNMSRIDSAILTHKYNIIQNNDTISVFAVNYNVLRILSGMGGLAYSN
jgi:uncharacterized protein YaaR (DUF327 family)